MKLYTRPRPLHVWQLRPGDQFAISKRHGRVIDSEAAYMDADLAERITWSVVHAVVDVGPELGGLTVYSIHHTLGENEKSAGVTVIVREVIEIDPWTYVTQRPPDPS